MLFLRAPDDVESVKPVSEMFHCCPFSSQLVCHIVGVGSTPRSLVAALLARLDERVKGCRLLCPFALCLVLSLSRIPSLLSCGSYLLLVQTDCLVLVSRIVSPALTFLAQEVVAEDALPHFLALRMLHQRVEHLE